MNFTKLATIVAFIAGSAQIAQAAELGSGISLNTDVVAEYKFDDETTAMTLTPEFGYSYGLVDFTVGTKLNLWDNANAITLDDEFDHLPVFDFGITYDLQDNLALEAITSYDFEAEERGEITLKATFSF